MSEEILKAIKIDEQARQLIDDALKEQSKATEIIKQKKARMIEEMNNQIDQECAKYQQQLNDDIAKHRQQMEKQAIKIETQLTSIAKDHAAEWVDKIVHEVIG